MEELVEVCERGEEAVERSVEVHAVELDFEGAAFTVSTCGFDSMR